jgi:hypothetical protein
MTPPFLEVLAVVLFGNKKTSKAFLSFDALMQIIKGFRCWISNAPLDGNNFRRAGYGTHAAADAPVCINPGSFINHFDRINRADFGTISTTDAFIKFGFTNKIYRH